jgi:hypothetical protein
MGQAGPCFHSAPVDVGVDVDRIVADGAAELDIGQGSRSFVIKQLPAGELCALYDLFEG